MLTLSPSQTAEFAGALLGIDDALVMPCSFDAKLWTNFYPEAATSPFFSELFVVSPSEHVHAQSSLRTQIEKARDTEKQGLVEHHIKHEIARILGVVAGQVSPVRSLQEMGLDSLMLLELRNRLDATLGIHLSSSILWRYPTLRALATHLVATLNASKADTKTSTPQEEEKEKALPSEHSIADLSDKDLLDELRQELASTPGDKRDAS